jgi:copper chaperone CopZ
MSTQRTTIPIYQLSCGGGGSLTIERALTRLDGVIRVYVNPATEMAYIEYDTARVSPAAFVAAVERVGFRVGEPSVR